MFRYTILTHSTGDHPHGGGRGKSKGNVHPVSPWGMPVSISFLRFISLLSLIRLTLSQAKGGYKTRKASNPNKWVVTARERNQGKRRVKKK